MTDFHGPNATLLVLLVVFVGLGVRIGKQPMGHPDR